MRFKVKAVRVAGAEHSVDDIVLSTVYKRRNIQILTTGKDLKLFARRIARAMASALHKEETE